MQGYIFDIKRFAVHDGPGIRTTIFLKGCPLKCHWCHNPEGLDKDISEVTKNIIFEGKNYQRKEFSGRIITKEKVMEIIKRDRIFMDESDGGVTFSGGEPTFQPDFLYSLLTACRDEGIHTAVDTCGFCPRDVLKKINPVTDLFLFDFKHPDHEKHAENTGISNCMILENLRFLLKSNKTVHIRIPLIPGFNLAKKVHKAIIKILMLHQPSIEKINLLPYHSLAWNKYKRLGKKANQNHIPVLKNEKIEAIKYLYSQHGFQVKTGG